VNLADWFPTADERGNASTEIDCRHPGGPAWSEGNRVEVLIDGDGLYEVLTSLEPGDSVYDLENADGTPIYVHAKACVIDDVWLMVGSDNLNRRSWTRDSELSCSVVDGALDERVPVDPAGLGDGARRLARDTRLRLWREHLGREDGNDADLLDPVSGFDALARSAADLDGWHEGDRRGSRPPGHLRRHALERVSASARWWAPAMYRIVLDPDGRPRRLRRTQSL
jgi:phosphatidylserine/phosphatidylglycerophosphate/cardiolipin synthase-like enzyme